MGDCIRHHSSNISVPEEFMYSTVENWCLTTVNVIKTNCLWTITNFICCQEKVGETIKSALFSSRNNEREKWCLRVCPRGPDEESKEYISLYLFLVSCNKPEVTAKFRFSLINGKGEEIKAMESQRAYKFVCGKDWGFKKFLKREYLVDENNSILPDDKLTIFCEISVITDPVSVFGKNEELKFKLPDCSVQANFEELFLTPKFSDVIISTNDEEFLVHKAILAARSPVFSAMFEHEMEEGQSNRVTVTDINSEAMREMLRFIYCGKVNNLKSMAFDLIAAADKYDLKRLKIMCEQILYRSICEENVVEILVLADRHSADELKTYAIEFILAHAKNIMDTMGWKSLIKSHSYLIGEIVKEMVSSSPYKQIKHQ